MALKDNEIKSKCPSRCFVPRVSYVLKRKKKQYDDSLYFPEQYIDVIASGTKCF